MLYCGSALYLDGVVDPWLAVHVSAATMLVYTCHRLFSSNKMSLDGQKRYSFASDHSSILLAVITISLPIAGLTFFYLDRPVQLALIVSGIISLGYIMPLIFRKRLRDIGVSKIILISMVWAALPILNVLESFDVTLTSLLFAEHFFFIFALTLPFDVRDQELDNKAQVSNLANTLGLAKLKVLLILCIALTLLSTTALYYLNFYNLVLFILIIVMLIAQLISTINLKAKRSELYYLFFLDSFILIKGLVYWISTGASQAF